MSKVYKICNCVESANGIAFGGGGGGGGYPASPSAVEQQANSPTRVPAIVCGTAAVTAVAAVASGGTAAPAAIGAIGSCVTSIAVTNVMNQQK